MLEKKSDRSLAEGCVVHAQLYLFNAYMLWVSRSYLENRASGFKAVGY
jgi:hypothetical protein